jgi:predicted oxidoreductase
MGSGPYYAIDTRVNNLSSVGGVAVDTSFRVLDDKGAFIPGLYAIGVECMSNLYNDTYTGVGAALCTVYTTGYLTAEGIAANK